MSDVLAMAIYRAKAARQTPRQINIVQIDDPRAETLQVKNDELASKNKALLCEINSLRISRTRLTQELETARQSLRDIMRIPAKAAATCPDLDAIVEAVCVEFHVTAKEIHSPSRAKEITFPRHCAMYLAHKISGRAMAAIARFFSRDHTVVIHAIEKIERLRAVDTHLDGRLAFIENRFRDGPENPIEPVQV